MLAQRAAHEGPRWTRARRENTRPALTGEGKERSTCIVDLKLAKAAMDQSTNEKVECTCFFPLEKTNENK